VVVASPYVPAAGDLVWISFDPQAGSEQAGRRPALVLSGAAYNRRTGLGLFCPITNRMKGYPFEVPLPGGLPISGAVLVDQIKCLDWRVRKAESVGIVPPGILAAAHDRLDVLMERQ
jgi:mRNA interferase MazF